MTAGVLPLAAAVCAAAPPLCRPNGACWPTSEQWAELNASVGGRLLDLSDAAGRSAPRAVCDTHDARQLLSDPTCMQSPNCAWEACDRSRPLNEPPYAVAARSDADVEAALRFAAARRVQVVVKSSGHDYAGRSTDSGALLVWMHRMPSAVRVEEDFKDSCGAAAPALVAQGGATWEDAYRAVGTAWHVVGGSALTVSAVGGYVMGGGLSTLSGAFGASVDNTLRFDVVTPDGELKVADACTNPDLFWALRGGGGGTFGVVTRVYHRLHPNNDGVVGLNFNLPAPPAPPGQVYPNCGLVNASEVPGPGQNGTAVEFLGNATGVSQCQALCHDYGRCNAWTWVTCEIPSWGCGCYGRVDAAFPVAGVAGSFCGFERGPLLDAREQLHGFLDMWVREAPLLDRRWGGFLLGAQGNFLTLYFPGTWADAVATAAPLRAFYDKSCAASWVWCVLTSFEMNNYTSYMDRHGNSTDATGTDCHIGSRLVPRDWMVNPENAGKLAAYMKEVSDAFGMTIIHQIGGAMNDVAANATALGPAMRAAQWHWASVDGPVVTWLRETIPSSGAYLNEVGYTEPDFEYSFWGSNYARLLQIKQEVDPQGILRCHNCVGGV